MKPFLLAIVLMILSGCTPYNRQPGCHLDKLNIKGNVTKIETIVESSMPLTELFENSFDPSRCISMYSGNMAVDFDKQGNARHTCGWGVDGKKLYDVNIVSLDFDGEQIPNVIGVSADQKIDDVKIVRNGDKVVNAKYFSDGALIWEQKVAYDQDGNIKQIIKDYASLKIETDFLSISYGDTTSYLYSDYDRYGNWRKATVEYKGVLPKHSHTYTVYRQLTYDGEDRHEALIRELAEINKYVQEHSDDTREMKLGRYGTMRIPEYMALLDDGYISKVNEANSYGNLLDYFFMSEYGKKDAYATISVCRIYSGSNSDFEDLLSIGRVYNEELDDYLEDANTEQMALGGVFVLKWLPYEFVRLSGKDALKVSYYRYGIGSPIPVYCENYTIPMDDGYTLNAAISYQSNLANRFRRDFDTAIHSIKLY